jgi:hypothetical protein
VWGLDPIVDMRHVTDRASSGSPRPQTAVRPRRAARRLPPAGEGLGREDARKGKFRTAAQMVAMRRGLDLPGWEAPYVLRDAKMGS